MKPFTLAYPDAVRLRVEIENLDTIFQRIAADGASAIDRADFAASMKALCSVTPETPEDVIEFLGANPSSLTAWKRKPHKVIDGAIPTPVRRRRLPRELGSLEDDRGREAAE